MTRNLTVVTFIFLAACGGPSRAADVWHFLDAWHFHRLDGIELCQGQPVWRKDKTYLDPARAKIHDHLNSWATVWQDKASRTWRMVYSAKWRPAALMVAESENGLNWRPRPCPDIRPEGGKIAPHHVFTLVDGSVGGAYLDPEARDGFRQPFIELETPGEAAGGALETSCLVETDTELRFYSDATAGQHGKGPKRDEANRPVGGIVLHTLRKDGLTYLRSQAGGGSFTSKPLVLFEPRLWVNLLAPQGEAQFQITDTKGVPLPGLRFEDAEPIAKVDDLQFALRWKNQSLDAVLNQPVRIEARLRNAQLYAVRGKFHFLDAEDMQRLQAGKSIDPRWFDY